MTQNLIDLDLSDDALAAIDEALTVLESRLGGLLSLDPAHRRQLNKMGDKSEAFCRNAVVAFGENVQVLPRNFDVAELQRDVASLDRLRPRLRRVERLFEKLNDTEMAIGSDLMTNSLEGYAVLKRAGKGEGLDAMRQLLAARFTRGKRTPPAVPEPA